MGCPPGGMAAPAPVPAKLAAVQEVRGEVEEDQSLVVQKPKQASSSSSKNRSKARFQEPKDVASAVISGRMHACETSEYLQVEIK